MNNEQRIEILKEKRDLINKVSPSFCSAKWLQTTLYLQNGYNHSCHHPAPHKIPIEEVLLDPSALHNSKFKKEQRKLMLEGKRPKECDYCWKIEDLNKDYFSDRHYKTADVQFAWHRFSEIAQSNPDDNVYPSYLEVSFSNACNFKCVYCSPEISSKWLEEINQFGPYPVSKGNHDITWLKQVGRYPYKHSEENPYVDAFWKWFPEALPYLKVFRITGGEPLMSKDTWRFFEFLQENPQTDLILGINTNLCVDSKLIDKFIDSVQKIKNCVKKVNIYTSLESTGAQAEYARYGLNYKTWIDNINTVLSLLPGTVTIMTTVNVLSLPTFVDFLSLIMSLRQKYNTGLSFNRINLSINYLRWPPYLSVKVLPQDIREHYAKVILEGLEKYKLQDPPEENNFGILYLEEQDQIKRFCEYLIQPENAQEDFLDFKKFIAEIDKRRGTNFNEIFPEYSNLINS